jgi:serine/threonine protein phosphatase PrpC
LRTAPAHLDFPDALLSIHADWLKAVAPLSPKDVATTILFARVSGEGNVHAAQLGDGLLLLRYAGKFHCITPERTGYGNQTQALETTLAPDQWHVFSGNFTLPGDGVVLLSDGVADDLEPEQLAEFVDALYQALSTKNRRRGRRWIHSELVNWATPMHGDDKTLAAIFRT